MRAQSEGVNEVETFLRSAVQWLILTGLRRMTRRATAAYSNPVFGTILVGHVMRSGALRMDIASTDSKGIRLYTMPFACESMSVDM